MSNSTPTQRAWYLITQAEQQLIANNREMVNMYTNLANAYFQIIDAEETEAISAWISNTANATANTLNLEAQTITAATAPTDAQVVWSFGDGSFPAITNKVLTSNFATLTTASAHGLLVGQKVVVLGVGAPFNSVTTLGSQTAFTITAVTTTTFTYAVTNADIPTAAATGTVQLAGIAVQHTFPTAGTYTISATIAAASLAAVTVARTLRVPYAA